MASQASQEDPRGTGLPKVESFCRPARDSNEFRGVMSVNHVASRPHLPCVYRHEDNLLRTSLDRHRQRPIIGLGARCMLHRAVCESYSLEEGFVMDSERSTVGFAEISLGSVPSHTRLRLNDTSS